MICVCGHSDDIHKDEEGTCTVCDCDWFVEDIDRDELEVE